MKVSDIKWEDLNIYKDIENLPEEKWKYFSVGGLQDRYMISNYGRCKRMPYTETGKTSEAYIVQITDNGKGYKKFALHTPKGLRNRYVHRLVAQAFIPNPDKLPQVNHKPDGLGKHDNRSFNLEWVTGSQNIRDAHSNGQMKSRSNYGELTLRSDCVIREAYKFYKENGGVSSTARMFGMPRTTFSSIVNKRCKVYITDEIDKLYENN